ncbi:thioredoxin 2 [Tachypleus tridentatus]|uniref:thioredoxin 2 n=1 Tax=Tachypleus tridentatus TaxID=6853 RepID=UPI003FD4C10E
MVHSVVDKDDFSAKLEAAGEKLVIVDFFATWCGPCKMIAPQLETLSEKLKDTVLFLKVDVDENEELSSEYEISCMPTFVFLKNKKVVHTISGAAIDKINKAIELLCK